MTLTRVCGATLSSKRTQWPTSSPGRVPVSCAMRAAIARAAIRRGWVWPMRPALPRVIDTFQVHLRELRAGDLEGSAGLFRLREELTRRVNHAIAPARIRAVLFREIVVQ